MSKIALQCKTCGVTFWRYASMCKGPKRGLYCSLKCSGAAPKSHGMSKTPTYASWLGLNKRHKQQERHAHATVCRRWRSFENFLADMGERPEGMTLDRIDNSKGYSPDNCRWATPKEQIANRSCAVTLEGGIKIQDLADEAGVSYQTMHARLVKAGLHHPRKQSQKDDA